MRGNVPPIAAGAKPPEGANLEHTIVSLKGIHHRASLSDEARHRFLAQHILARFRCCDGNERMPMRRRGDGNQINVLALQHAPKIRVDFFIVRPAHKLYIAQGKLLDVEPFTHGVVGARSAPTYTNECPAKRLARRRLPCPTHDMPRHYLAGCCRGHGGG